MPDAPVDQQFHPSVLLGLRLRERIAAIPDMTARKLSLAIGANASYVAQLLSGKGGTPAADKLAAMADQLETTADYLSGRSNAPTPQILSEVGFRELPKAWRDPAGDGLRVLATGYCADLIIDEGDGVLKHIEQIQLEVDHTIRTIPRPAALWNAHSAYAIYFEGSSMERRFYAGELGVVDPSRPAGRGNVVLVKLTDGEGDGTTVIKVLVKELVQANSRYVELLQYNPEMTFRVPRGQVVAIERVYRPDELLGI